MSTLRVSIFGQPLYFIKNKKRPRDDISANYGFAEKSFKAHLSNSYKIWIVSLCFYWFIFNGFIIKFLSYEFWYMKMDCSRVAFNFSRMHFWFFFRCKEAYSCKIKGKIEQFLSQMNCCIAFLLIHLQSFFKNKKEKYIYFMGCLDIHN